jgi:DNA polymerase
MADDRRAQLEAIAREIQNLEESPLYSYRKENGFSPVVGEGDSSASIVFIGEAPGRQEAKTGRPFVGNAGRVLDELLESIDLKRQDVYITNVVKDRPPKNRDPRADEIRLYAPFLLRQLDVIEPRVLATLGRFATDLILDHFDLPEQGKRMGDLHGRVLEAQADYGTVAVVPLYHPAAVFYNQDLRETLEEDFAILKQFT